MSTQQALSMSRCYVDGEWIAATDGSTIAVTNPANGELVGEVPGLGRRETRLAIEAAGRAFIHWRERTAEERATLMRRWAALMMANQEELATLMTREQGKPIAESRGEIAYAASYVDWFAEEARRIDGEVIPSPWRGKQILAVKEPVGVCAAITPWNFPSAMITRKAAPALAAGCTMVVKPASQTPLSALALARLAELAGIPAGVFNVVTGSASAIGAELTAHPMVRKLSFTGSTEIGRALAAQCAPTLKKLSLELGGNAPFIVFEDADLDAAVVGAIASKYRNTGQTCVCTNRILVQDAIHDAFVHKLAKAVSELRVGDGLEPDVTQGPLIDERALAKLDSLVEDARSKGGRVVVGGRRHGLGGTFYEPTLVVEAREDMAIAREEAFGPVAPVFRFRDEAEAVRMANDTEYGLAAYFYSRDLARAWRVAGQLEYGMVGINSGILSTAVAPFGGVKQSGYGREGSRHGIDDYVHLKYLCMGVE
ncbi:MAG TPA: NAD-dependent succinate-semialdehyde dehydrogenase [Burkholderiaceae bacterium]